MTIEDAKIKNLRGNVWVGVSRNSMINRILFLPTGYSIKKNIYDSISEDLKKYNEDKESIKTWSKDALVMEEKYFYEIKNINENHNLYEFKNKILIEGSLSPSNKVISLKKIDKEILEEKDFIKFLIIENDESLYFLSINSRKIIKKGRLLNISNKNSKDNKGTGISSNIVEINSGIHIPSNITAVFEKKAENLYVLDVSSFEKMLYLNEKNKEKAEKNLNKFLLGEYTISSDDWKVDFEDIDKIKDEIFKRNRAINRLSNFDNDSTFDIVKIKEAVSQLPEVKNRVIFDDDNNIVKVNKDNYKTFIGIIHNGIVKRLISGDVDVVL